VLLNVEGVVKLTDFGIAKAREVMEQDEDILMGRMEYMSPEQSRRDTTDARSDLYSVGVLAYETLTGKTPDRGPGSLLRQHGLGQSYPQPIHDVREEIPDGLWTIIEKALQPAPEKRFQTAAEMGFALEYYLYHKGYGPTNVSLREYLRKHFGDGLEIREPRPDETDRRTAQVVEHRSETEYGKDLEDE
jgi:serine/threonine-protein kinase